MTGRLDEERLRRFRLAAQRLTPATAAADVSAAARAVVGVQAQDVRAAGLALRSRAPGLRRADVDGSGLVRTWTVRGTVHLIDPSDWPWLQAVVGLWNRVRFEAAMRQRGDHDVAVGMLDDIVAVLRDRPLDRAGLLRELAARVVVRPGARHGSPGPRRPVAHGGSGELLALPGTLDATPPPAPPALLLAAFDTIMLGYRTRAPLVMAEDDRHILPGGEMLRPAVLIDGLAAGTWTLTANGKRRSVTIDWFRRPAESPELRAEQLSVESFPGPG
ncbi:MAG: DNA glycosylase AlkZ-like family protein [Streptosporangiaceae bacterium]